jgi:hypothetical protein
MASRYPSISALMQIKDVTREDAKRIREIMKGYAPVPCKCGRMSDPSSMDAYPYNVCSYFHDGRHRYSRMAAIDTVLGTFGVEYVAAGHNSKSPAFSYCNTGDTYDVTVLKVRGHFRVGCWGDIVERGNYD